MLTLGSTLYSADKSGTTNRRAWFKEDALARDLSQLTPEEYSKFEGSPLIDVRPAVLPTPDNVVGANDYFMWPITTMIDDTMVVLYERTPCHWGPDKAKSDENSGVRMIVTSSDGGETWSRPVDLLKAGRWAETPFRGFGGGLGVHDGIVYAALNQGLYRSADKGASWKLASAAPRLVDVPEPLWAPGMRLTFDAAHGLTIWTTSGFSLNSDERKKQGRYGTHLVALYSPDFGTTWHAEQQELPDGLRLSEITPVQFDGKIAFFLRNGLKDKRFGQGYSASGWFPFQFALSNVGPVKLMDTPDVNYNPVTRRLEAAAPHRDGTGPGPQGGMKVNLYSIAPADLAKNSSEWRYEGTLVRYKDQFGRSDGFNAVASVIDPRRGRKVFHMWAGNRSDKAGIYQYSVSLDTPAVSRYLLHFYGSRSEIQQ